MPLRYGDLGLITTHQMQPGCADVRVAMCRSVRCADHVYLTACIHTDRLTAQHTWAMPHSAGYKCLSEKLTAVALQVPLPPIDERKKVIEDLDKDRRYAVDAAIVRTMKSRKVLQHQQLTMEVVQQLSRMFKADFKLIKKRIEDLMGRDYLERDKDNPNLLRYLA